MIPDEVINEVLERTDIVQLVGRTVDLRKAGTLYKGLCPFHSENTPSFTVSPVRRTYHCFGCGAHGHAIRWMMDHEGRNFPEAVKGLAAACGVEVPEDTRESPEVRAARERKRTLEQRLLAVQDQVTAFFTDALHGPSGGRARAYLADRGVSPRAAEAFRLGWADGDKYAFGRFATEKEIARDDLVALGLLLEPDAGWDASRPLDGGYLRFRERLMFPVVDVRGEVVGYSGRILDPKAKAAKYVNSPETPVFTKGDQLYGAYTARSAARRAGRLVLCEGNVDVISLWQAGIEGTAAAMGTALTPKQVRLVKRLGEQVVCIMDGDEAGAKAAFGSLVPFLEAGLQPRAVMLPTGEDPDSFVRACGVETLMKLIDDAPPLLDLYIRRVAGAHPADPPGRAAALYEIAPALTRLPDALTRALYRDHVAAALQVPATLVDDALDGALPAPQRPPEPARRPPAGATPSPAVVTGRRRDRAAHGASASVDSAPRFEREVFEFIVQYPQTVVHLHESGEHNGLTHPGMAAFVACLYREVCAGRTPNEDQILRELDDPQVVTYVRDLQVRPPSLTESNIDAAFEGALHRLRRGRLERQRHEANARLAQAVQSGDPERRIAALKELKAIQEQLRDLSSRTSRES